MAQNGKPIDFAVGLTRQNPIPHHDLPPTGCRDLFIMGGDQECRMFVQVDLANQLHDRENGGPVGFDRFRGSRPAQSNVQSGPSFTVSDFAACLPPGVRKLICPRQNILQEDLRRALGLLKQRAVC